MRSLLGACLVTLFCINSMQSMITRVRQVAPVTLRAGAAWLSGGLPCVQLVVANIQQIDGARLMGSRSADGLRFLVTPDGCTVHERWLPHPSTLVQIEAVESEACDFISTLKLTEKDAITAFNVFLNMRITQFQEALEGDADIEDVLGLLSEYACEVGAYEESVVIDARMGKLLAQGAVDALRNLFELSYNQIYYRTEIDAGLGMAIESLKFRLPESLTDAQMNQIIIKTALAFFEEVSRQMTEGSTPKEYQMITGVLGCAGC